MRFFSIQIFLAYILCWNVNLVAKTIELDFPSSCRLGSIETFIYSVIRKDNTLFLTTKDADFFIRTPFYGLRDSSYKIFGGYLDSKRIIIPKALGKLRWHSSFIIENKIGFMDGINLQVYYFGVKDNQFIVKKELIWDMIKPPKDRIGEPTQIEINKHRSNFKKHFIKTVGVKIVGISHLEWLDTTNTNYFIFVSSISGYPFLLGYCDKMSLSCVIDRFCYVNKFIFKKDGRYRGVGIDTKNQTLIIGDFKDHKLHKFKFNSCLNISYVDSISLPSKIKEISSVYVDQDDNLWVSSIAADNYTNSSVFCWESSKWK